MTDANFDRLLHLIGLIYDAAIQPSLWPDFMAQLCQVIPSTSSNVHAVEVTTGVVRLTYWDLAPETQRLYFERYHHLNLYYTRDLPLMRTGLVRRSHETCPPEEAEQTEFYQEFLRPLDLFHLLNVCVLKEGDIAGNLSLARSKAMGMYTDEEAHLLGLLVPHLQRAFRISHLLEGLKLERDLLRQTLDQLPQGALIVNRTGQLMYANRNAELILACNDGLSINRQRDLQAAFANENAQLRQMITSAGEPAALLPAESGGLFQLTRPSGLRSLSLLIVPLNHEISQFNYHQPTVLIFISDPEQQTEAVEERLQHLYRLTPAEAKLAVILIRGNNTAAAAAELRITQNTARTHLKRIFQKTGTHRQSELVNLLLKSPATLK